tara:strand:+ start:50 stop:424 length:375 start_codon:yes stop_codon:yes gene_type:complete
MKNNHVIKKQSEIWFLISSIGIFTMIIDFSRRLFFISEQPWWSHLPTTSLEGASPIWLSAIFIFIYVYLFLVKKIAKPAIAFLVWLSCSMVISIPTTDKPFYFFLFLILISSLYATIQNLKLNR